MGILDLILTLALLVCFCCLALIIVSFVLKRKYDEDESIINEEAVLYLSECNNKRQNICYSLIYDFHDYIDKELRNDLIAACEQCQDNILLNEYSENELELKQLTNRAILLLRTQGKFHDAELERIQNLYNANEKDIEDLKKWRADAVKRHAKFNKSKIFNALMKMTDVVFTVFEVKRDQHIEKLKIKEAAQQKEFEQQQKEQKANIEDEKTSTIKQRRTNPKKQTDQRADKTAQQKTTQRKEKLKTEKTSTRQNTPAKQKIAPTQDNLVKVIKSPKNTDREKMEELAEQMKKANETLAKLSEEYEKLAQQMNKEE